MNGPKVKSPRINMTSLTYVNQNKQIRIKQKILIPDDRIRMKNEQHNKMEDKPEKRCWSLDDNLKSTSILTVPHDILVFTAIFAKANMSITS